MLDSAVEFIETTEKNQMVMADLAYEMDRHAKKINEYENGKRSIARKETINSALAQITKMADSM